FDYYDKVTTGPNTPNELNGFRDGVRRLSGERIDGDPPFLQGSHSTNLGGDVGYDNQFHFYAGIGYTAKEISGGVKVGAQLPAGSDTKLALIDLNGDGVPDQVYERDNAFYYRPNLGGPQRAPSFGDETPLPSLAAIGKETNTTFTVGVEGF